MRDGIRDHAARAHTVKPQLTELLRTCIHPTGLFLRIANVVYCDIVTELSAARTENDSIVPPDTDRQYAIKLLLSDGQLMIEALLHRKLSILTEAADLQPGDLLDIRKYVVKKAKRTNDPGTVVYLGIEDCYFIKHNVSHVAPATAAADAAVQEQKQQKPKGHKRGAQHVDGDTDNLRQNMEEPQSQNKKPRLGSNHTQGTNGKVKTISSMGHEGPRGTVRPSHPTEEDEFDDFEVLETDEQRVRSRRKALQELHNNTLPSSSSICNDKASLQDQAFRPPPQVPVHAYQLSQCKYPPNSSHPPLEAATVQQVTKPTPPLTVPKSSPAPPLHTLASLRMDITLPTRNYAATVLAYVSWAGTTLIHQPGSPFPPKRHVKLVDASLVTSRPGSRNDNQGISVTAMLQHGNNAGSRPVSRSGPAMSSSSTPRSSTVFTPQNSFQDAITLAVFADAATFKPTAGTLALFRGVVMQRLGNGDVILNAYARIKEQSFLARDGNPGRCAESWYLDDIDVIRELGYATEVEALRQWWEER